MVPSLSFLRLSCTRFRRHRVRCFMEQEVCHGEKAVYAGDLTRESPVLDVWKGYLKVHLIPEATGSSVARFRGIFEKRILPKWRARPIAGMVKADALTVIDAALLRGQSAKNSTITVLSSFFNWCMDRNLIEHSPVERVKKIKMKSRKRKLSDSEIRIFWHGCDALGS